ncbi:DsrE family protein [Desulfovibrio sp. OttesenSCG-928-G15]|nr:DsrE family protein [Desulfovibrio sp. OttesenSCG-928-G15]
MISSCTVLIRKPLGKEEATLGIRSAWAMFSSAGMDVKIILLGDGIYSVLGKSGYVKNLFARFLGEEGEIHAVKEDMEQRGIEESMLPDGITVTPAADIPEVLGEGSVLTF